MPLKIDLHLHTHYSGDATTTLKELLYYAKKRGLDGVAVTDHDTTLGAVRLTKQKHALLIIPGIEVSSLHGHVLALNVTQPITPKLSLPETVEKIHQLGGIAVIAHPSAVLKTGLGHTIIPSASTLDAVEVVNTAAFPYFFTTYLSRRLAQRLKLPQTAGSDAHHPAEIGTAHTRIDSKPYPDDIIEAIRKGRITPYGKPISWFLRLKRGTASMQTKVGGR